MKPKSLSEWFIYKGESCFGDELEYDWETDRYKKQDPCGFYDLVSPNDTIIGATHVIAKTHYDELLKRAEVLVSALEFECGNRCAEQNPCNAKEALREWKEWVG